MPGNRCTNCLNSHTECIHTPRVCRVDFNIEFTLELIRLGSTLPRALRKIRGLRKSLWRISFRPQPSMYHRKTPTSVTEYWSRLPIMLEGWRKNWVLFNHKRLFPSSPSRRQVLQGRLRWETRCLPMASLRCTSTTIRRYKTL